MRPANACSRRSPPRKIDGGTNDEAGALERAVGNSRRATLVAEKLGSQSPAKQAALSSSKFSHFQSVRFCLFLWLKVRPVDVKVRWVFVFGLYGALYTQKHENGVIF